MSTRCCRNCNAPNRVIGYNVIDFDFEVLAPYAVFDLSQVPVLDLMRDVEKNIGLRVGLDAISEQTLGCGKTADGMESLKWWKEGKLRPIAEYCCYDVKATRLVHEYGPAVRLCFLFQQEDAAPRKSAGGVVRAIGFALRAAAVGQQSALFPCNLLITRMTYLRYIRGNCPLWDVSPL